MAIKRMTKADHPQSFGAFKPVGHVVVAMPDDARAAAAVRALRDAGFLGGLTHFVHYAPALAAVLLLVPVARGPVRIAAAALIALHGLVWGTLFTFTSFGWGLVAASALAARCWTAAT